MSNAVAKGATGADEFSSRSLIPTSPLDACQSGSVETEPSFPKGIQSAGAQISRRSVMNMVVSAALTGAAIPQNVKADDPIFAAIEAHKKAKREFEECFRARNGDDDTTPDRFSRIETETACELASIVPTSLEGVLALAVYAAEVDKDGMGWPDGLVTDEKQKLGRSWYFYAMKNLAEGIQAHSRDQS